MAVVMSALAPMTLFAQNAAPTTPPAGAAVGNPTGAATSRPMVTRNGKWRHRNHHRNMNMNWRNAGNGTGAMRGSGMPTTGAMYRPAKNASVNGAAATTNANAATTATKTHHGRHHKTMTEKQKSTPNTAKQAATQASKTKTPPKAKNIG
jgi:hypothetical protein